MRIIAVYEILISENVVYSPEYNEWMKPLVKNQIKLIIQAGREGTLDWKLHKSPKLYNHVIILVGLKPLGTKFDCFFQTGSV